MMKKNIGPIINSTKRAFTTRDSLGIESVLTSIQAEICPIVNTVTPRAFYWAMINWCYFDYYENHNKEDRTKSNVNKYIKRNNYFFLLSQLLKKGKTDGFVGVNGVFADFSKDKYEYNENYVETALSTMVYYPPGLNEMGMVVQQDETGSFNNPKLRPECKKFAEAFASKISNTNYYNNRFSNLPVNKKDLVELGKIIDISLDGFDECKEILRDHLFNRKYTFRLAQCKDLINYTYKKYETDFSSESNCRHVLYDYYSPRSENKELTKELKNIADSWEIAIGRQYFTMGLEIIWNYMLNVLKEPLTIFDWIKECLNKEKGNIDFDSNLSSILERQNLDFNERETIIETERSGRSKGKSIEHGLNIMLSVYNRFLNRNDINEEIYRYCSIGNSKDQFSLTEFFDMVENYKNKSIKSFLEVIMKEKLIKQHLNTAFEKMLNNRDGYYIEEIDGKYIKVHDFELKYQGLRLVQLFNIMKDLDILGK